VQARLSLGGRKVGCCPRLKQFMTVGSNQSEK
jgi:hypothetical protein